MKSEESPADAYPMIESEKKEVMVGAELVNTGSPTTPVICTVAELADTGGPRTVDIFPCRQRNFDIGWNYQWGGPGIDIFGGVYDDESSVSDHSLATRQLEASVTTGEIQ